MSARGLPSLPSAPVAWRIHRHGVVDSTSERAFAALAAGEARHGDVFVATAQSAGRGRLGRRWESPVGEGLYLSVVVAPPAPGPPPPALTLAGGLAVLEGAERLGLGGARLDWPNDLVVGERKLAGVLVESRGLDPTRPCYVLGIGLNVRQRAFSPELSGERAVTSLLLEGVDVELAAALEAVLAALAPRLDEALGTDPALGRDFLARTGLLARRVEVRCGGTTHHGELAALDPACGLTLRTASGSLTLPLAHVQGVDLRPG